MKGKKMKSHAVIISKDTIEMIIEDAKLVTEPTDPRKDLEKIVAQMDTDPMYLWYYVTYPVTESKKKDEWHFAIMPREVFEDNFQFVGPELENQFNEVIEK
jgi:hypothetical protein